MNATELVTVLNPSRLFLTGYRGAGKSVVARRLAPLLGCQAVDADQVIVERAGKSIASLFAEEGESAFRDLEEQVVAELCQCKNVTVALGGGAVLREATRNRLRQAGPVVWLTADAETLAKRIGSDETSAANRPALTNLNRLEEVKKLLAERNPLYQQCATVSFDTGVMSPDDVAADIIRWLQSR